jgi:hypothetical protein
LFGVFLLAAAALMHLYVFWRASSVPAVARRVPRAALAGTGAFLWAGFTAARVLGHGGSGGAAAVLEAIAMNWLAMLFLASVSLLALDLATGFGSLAGRSAPSLRGWALAAGGVLSAIALFQGLRAPLVEEYDVRLPGLPERLDGTVLVAMSDLHLGTFRGERWLAARVEQVLALRPDLVVLLGDLFEGHGPPRQDLIPALGNLSAPLGVWAVAGNHESHGRGGNGMFPSGEAGIRVLDNRWAEVLPGLVLAGVDGLPPRLRNGKGENPIGRALAGSPPGARILLQHAPVDAEKAAAAGVGLMLSGHTHGGQIWPLGYLVRLAYPYVEGIYETGGMKIVVSRGTGNWGACMRLWRPAQILRITLRS